MGETLPAGRIRRAGDFQRALSTPTRVRSEHFVIHHLPPLPSSSAQGPRTGKLSTGNGAQAAVAVDDSAAAASSRPAACGAEGQAAGASACTRQWLGLVVPKRHARRSVTRQLVRRQIRACFADAAGQLDDGWWVVRLRAAFDPQRFVSAASASLRAAVRSELTDAFVKAQRSARCGVAAPAA
jgi:ribonuclease P protein component